MEDKERDFISESQIDSSVVIGFTVVLAIISATAFGIYYFVFLQPERESLEEAKNDTLRSLQINLGEVNTSRAQVAASNYRTKINVADTQGEVSDLADEISEIYRTEKTRSDLLSRVNKTTSGKFSTLETVREDLKSRIDSAETLSKLSDIDEEVRETVMGEWKGHHLNRIAGVFSDDITILTKENGVVSERIIEESKARSLVQEGSLSYLQSIKISNPGGLIVPIIDEFQKTPTLEKGERVNVYQMKDGELFLRSENSRIVEVIYPVQDFSQVSFSESDNGERYSFSTDIWDQIKANVSNNNENSFEWDNWGHELVKTARENAQIGDFALKVIYAVRISSHETASDVMQIEQSTGNIVILEKWE